MSDLMSLLFRSKFNAVYYSKLYNTLNREIPLLETPYRTRGDLLGNDIIPVE